jgi:hypothetical protein
MHFASSGSSGRTFSVLGEIPELCWGWSVLTTFLHDDDTTVTLLYDPAGGCAPQNDSLYFGTSSLTDPTMLADERPVHNRGGERSNVILKDTENGVWRWYYNKVGGPNAGSIQLRTHPLSNDTMAPAAPTTLTAD